MISVVIPAFDSASYILESVSSVTRQFQSGGEVEVLVIDDGSSDNTGELVRGLMERNPDVRYFRQDHHFAASARNRGISEACGEWIYLLDADDVSTEGSLAALREAADGSGADAVFARTLDFVSPELTEGQKAALLPRAGAYPGILPGASLVRKTVFDKVGLFDTSLPTGETIDWMLRFRKSGFRAEHIGFVALHRRLHLSNTGRLRKSSEAADYARIIRERLRDRR